MEDQILFVDDEVSLLSAIERLLGFDYNLRLAESGAAGLEMIREHGPFTIIFTDMRMPGMDGLEFIKQAREMTPKSIFVMLSGNNDEKTELDAIDQGRVFRFLQKPCDEAQLVEAIEACKQQYDLGTQSS
ncbi:MAG: response regulator [Planctomycetota bacterium]